MLKYRPSTGAVVSALAHVLGVWTAYAPVHATGLEHPGARSCQKANSPRFAVYSYCGGPDAKEVLEQCEHLYQQLGRYWFGHVPDDPWPAPCYVVLHADRASYGRVAQNDASVGRSSIRFAGGRIISRRIDLLVNQQGRPAALAHELSHILLADRWPSGPPPKWLDEGLALCADSPSKKTLHWRDCRAATMQGTAIGLKQLLTADTLTRNELPAVVFYGQSLALVTYLLENGPPEKVLAFAARARVVGYDCALRECYGIEGIADLERRWYRYVADSSEGIQQAMLATALYD